MLDKFKELKPDDILVIERLIHGKNKRIKGILINDEKSADRLRMAGFIEEVEFGRWKETKEFNDNIQQIIDILKGSGVSVVLPVKKKKHSRLSSEYQPGTN